jgi:hypothetical protein
VLGKQMIIEGKPRLFSVVSPQKAAQQLINYSKSRIAETLSIAPISPYMVANGQLAGFEAQWSSLNKSPDILTYNVVDTSGRPIPPPSRQTFEPPIQALSAFVAQEVEDMKATTGIFDASLGQQSNETSGQAIKARQQQSDSSTMHFMDNLLRSFRKAGDVISELIPIIYDTPRTIQILGADEEQKIIQINKKHVDEGGKSRHYDMTAGKYDVVVTMGRAFSSKRMESFDMLQQLVQTAPNMLPMFGDIMFKNSDMAGSDIVSERFKKMLPPNLQADDDQEQVPPQAQAQLQQLQQHNQALNAAAQEYEKQIQKLTFEKQAKVVEMQGRMQEIAAKSQADMALEDKKLLTQITVAEISTKAQILSEREAAIRELEAQFHEQAHDVAMQAQGAQHAQAAQAQQADAQSQQSAQEAEQSQQAQQQQPEPQPAQV